MSSGSGKGNITPSTSPAFRQARMTLAIQFPIRQKILTFTLLTIVCMLIACIPTAALILIKKYIWVRKWITNPSGLRLMV